MASSILTNASAMAALENISATQRTLGATQSQISSGLKVATASDNAAYWSISSTMRSDTGALSAVSGALNLGASVVGTAAAAIASTLTLLDRIKADLVAARQPGTSAAAVQSDIAAQQKSLISILSSASFNGVNLLDGSAGSPPLQEDEEDGGDLGATPMSQSQVVSVSPVFPGHPIGPIGHPIIGPVLELIPVDATLAFVTSFQRSSGGATALGTVALDTTTTNLIGAGGVLNGAPGNAGATSIATMDITASGASLATMQADTEAAIASVAAVGALVGGIGTTIANQQTYVAALSNAVTSGVGSLVDADMNVASTRLRALQVQERLGLQALSIANGNSRLVLKLFTAA